MLLVSFGLIWQGNSSTSSKLETKEDGKIWHIFFEGYIICYNLGTFCSSDVTAEAGCGICCVSCCFRSEDMDCFFVSVATRDDTTSTAWHDNMA